MVFRAQVGSYASDGGGGSAGSARVFAFDADADAWIQRGEDLDGGPGDYAGYAVALDDDGDVVAVGAPYADGNGGASGRARCFQWAGGAWTQLGQDIDGEAADDWSGYAVALNDWGNFLAVGATRNDGPRPEKGKTSWPSPRRESKGDLDRTSTRRRDRPRAIGRPVAGGGNKAGHVRVYQLPRNGEAWIQLGGDFDGAGAGDNAGRSVSLSATGGILAFGAPYADADGASNAGAVEVYRWNGWDWNPMGDPIYGSDSEYSGWAVSLSGDGQSIAVGAIHSDARRPRPKAPASRRLTSFFLFPRRRAARSPARRASTGTRGGPASKTIGPRTARPWPARPRRTGRATPSPSPTTAPTWPSARTSTTAAARTPATRGSTRRRPGSA